MKKLTLIFYLFVFLFFSFGVQLLVNRAIAGCCQYSEYNGNCNDGHCSNGSYTYYCKETTEEGCTPTYDPCPDQTEGSPCTYISTGYFPNLTCGPNRKCESPDAEFWRDAARQNIQ